MKAFIIGIDNVRTEWHRVTGADTPEEAMKQVESEFFGNNIERNKKIEITPENDDDRGFYDEESIGFVEEIEPCDECKEDIFRFRTEEEGPLHDKSCSHWAKS